MTIRLQPVKSLPVSGAFLKRFDEPFFAGYLGYELSERERERVKGLHYRRWTDAIEISNAMAGGGTVLDESKMIPVNFEDRHKRRLEIQSIAFGILNADERLRDGEALIVSLWLEGLASGPYILDKSPEEYAKEAVAYAKRYLKE